MAKWIGVAVGAIFFLLFLWILYLGLKLTVISQIKWLSREKEPLEGRE